MVSQAAFVGVIAALALQRLVELRRSRRNEERLLAAGGREHAPGHFVVMRTLHASWLVAMVVEVLALGRPFVPALAVAAAAVALAGEALRHAAMRGLGERWTVRIVTVPGWPRIEHGIYRHLRHPNYLGVALEIAAVPLLHCAYLTAIFFTLANACLLAVRIRAEERALGASPPAGGSGWMRRYATCVVDHPRAVLLVLLVAIIWLGSQARHLELGLRLIDLLPQRHPHSEVFRKIRAQFGVEHTVFVAVRARNGTIFTETGLRTVQQITEAVGRLPGVVPASVLSLASPRVKRIREAGGDLDVAPLMERVPAGADALERLRAEAVGSALYRNLLVAEDARAASVIADFSDEIAGADLHRALEAIAARARDGDTEIALGGAPVLGSHLQRYSGGVVWIFPVTLAVVALIHYEAFRTLQAMLLPLLAALVSLVLSLGVMGLVGHPIDPWNAVTPVIILGLAAGHAVQMLKRYYEELARLGDNRQAIIEAVVGVGPVMLAAGGIAAAGFASLATFGVPSVRVFGTLLACGVAAALVVEMTLIPACRALLPVPARVEQQRAAASSFMSRGAEALSPRVVAAPRRVLVLAAIVAATAVAGMLRLEVNNSFRDWFYPGSAARVDDELINASFGGSATLHLLLEGDAPGSLEDPQVVRAVADLAGLLRQEPSIGKVMSYVDFLEQMHRTLANGELPTSRALAAQYLLLYEVDLGPEGLGGVLDPSHRWALVTAFSRSDESEVFRRLIDRVEDFATTRFVGLPARLHVAAGSIGTQVAMNEEVVREKLVNALQVGSIVLVLASLTLRSLVGGLLVLAPLALAVIVNLGVMGWSGTWLAMTTAAITAMGVSIGADFAIYLLFRIREERRRGRPLEEAVEHALGTAGQATWFVSSAIVAGYLTLVFAGFRTWTQVGGLTALMVATAALATVTVIPALILVARPTLLVRAR